MGRNFRFLIPLVVPVVSIVVLLMCTRSPRDVEQASKDVAAPEAVERWEGQTLHSPGDAAGTAVVEGERAPLALVRQESSVDGPVKEESPGPEEPERVCFSLRVLSAMVSKVFSEGSSLPRECNSQAGIGFLDGFIIDETGKKDIVLVGRRSKSRPSLKLDDLIVNMRHSGGTGAYPYCSLEPQKEAIRAFQSLAVKSQRLQSIAEMKAFFAELESAIGPQQVVVGGVPENSRHAHVMVDADYHMKKVSQGHIALPGITSYLDRSLNEAKKSILKGRAPKTGISLARFWFHIGSRCPTFQKSRGIVWLGECRVVVLTEKQKASASGELYDVKEDDPVATAFAEELSKEFPKLTLSVPVYADLENLFRLRALVLAMGLRDSLHVLGFDSDSFLRGHRFQDEAPMDPSYPGLANHKEWSHRISSGSMIYEYHLFPMVCGGVGMDMEIEEASFRDDMSGRLSSFRTAALLARPSKDSLFWVVSASP